MTQQEIEQCFDFPVPDERIEGLTKRMIEDGWKIGVIL